jgi:hypothetical protein
MERKYCHDLCVTTDGVWIGDLIYWPLAHLRLVTSLYRSLSHTDYYSQSSTASTNRFVATDVDTRTIAASLNYTLQVSHIKSALHSRTLATNSCLHSLPYRTEISTENCLDQSQSQSYFTTDGLPPISSSWRQAPWDSWLVILFSNWTLAVTVLV